MNHCICPNCQQKIEQNSYAMLLFPFKWYCSHCKAKLTLKSYKLLNIAFFAYLLLVIAAVIYIPIIRQYGISVILSVLGWLLLYQKLTPKVFDKRNISLK